MRIYFALGFMNQYFVSKRLWKNAWGRKIVCKERIVRKHVRKIKGIAWKNHKQEKYCKESIVEVFQGKS